MPQEFVDDPDQQANFVGEVHFHHPEMIKEQIRRHVRNFCEHYKQKALKEDRFMKEEDDDDDDAEDGEEDDVADLEPLANTATEYFKALFNVTYDSFQNAESMAKYFMDSEHERHNGIEDRLYPMVQMLMKIPEYNTKSNTAVFESRDLAKLQDELRPYTESKARLLGYVSASMWPLVYKVRVNISSRLLRQGFEVVDLPGVTDTNQDRLRTTFSAIERCSVILIAHPFQRAATEPNLLKYVKTALRRKRPENIIILITKTDVISEDPRYETIEQKNELVAASTEATAAKTEYENFVRTNNASNASNAPDFDSQKMRLYLIKESAAAKQTGKRVEIATQNLITKLREGFRRISTVTDQIRIICVSNKEHEKYFMGPDPYKPPCLTLQQAGICELRRTLVVLAHRGKLDCLQRHTNIHIPCDLKRLQLWAEKSRLERKELLDLIIEFPRDRCTEGLQEMKDAMQEDIKSAIQREMGNKLKKEWKMKILEFCRDISKEPLALKCVSFMAFCRRGGRHHPSNKKEPISLNEEILGVVTPDMLTCRQMVETVISNATKDVLERQKIKLDKVRNDMKANDEVGGLDMQVYFEQFEKRAQGMWHDINTARDALKDSIL